MSEFIDVSFPIRNGMMTWPSDPPVEIGIWKAPSKGDRSTVSVMSLGTHTGTHIDAPRHFLPDAEGIETVAPEALIGPCMVLDVRGRGNVGSEELRPAIEAGAERVLLRTGTLERQVAEGFSKDFPALTGEGARALVDAGARTVGIDSMSIEAPGADEAPTHHALLEGRVAIIETLWLADVPEGRYEMIALPLRIDGADGAPARVLLRPLDD